MFFEFNDEQREFQKKVREIYERSVIKKLKKLGNHTADTAELAFDRAIKYVDFGT